MRRRLSVSHPVSHKQVVRRRLVQKTALDCSPAPDRVVRRRLTGKTTLGCSTTAPDRVEVVHRRVVGNATPMPSDSLRSGSHPTYAATSSSASTRDQSHRLVAPTGATDFSFLIQSQNARVHVVTTGLAGSAPDFTVCDSFNSPVPVASPALRTPVQFQHLEVPEDADDLSFLLSR